MTGSDWQNAIIKTDNYYAERRGESYSNEQVDRWIAKWYTPFVKMTGKERVLDLCCGDGCWSFGLLRLFPKLEITGIDISAGATDLANERARKIGVKGSARFLAHDCEADIPISLGNFDLIFARGLFVYNQHDMMRNGCLQLLDHWHNRLSGSTGRFVAMYGSKPGKFGTYTAPEDTAGLPTNLCPRITKAVNFCGGKFNHSPATFVRPFLSLSFAQVVFYQFSHGRHTLISQKID